MKGSNSITPAAAIPSGTAAAVAGGPHTSAPAAPPAAAASASYIAVHRIEGRRIIDPGTAIPAGEFDDVALDRLLGLGAIANAAEVEAERVKCASTPNPVNYVLQFLRAKQDLRAWVLGERDYRIAAGKVFLVSQNVSEPGFLAGLVEPVGRPTSGDAETVFTAYRGRAADLFALWARAAGTPFYSQRTDFLATVEPAPAELPPEPTIFVGRDPAPAAKTKPVLPEQLTSPPRHLP